MRSSGTIRSVEKKESSGGAHMARLAMCAKLFADIAKCAISAPPLNVQTLIQAGFWELIQQPYPLTPGPSPTLGRGELMLEAFRCLGPAC
jgi:hypothetical protein